VPTIIAHIFLQIPVNEPVTLLMILQQLLVTERLPAHQAYKDTRMTLLHMTPVLLKQLKLLSAVSASALDPLPIQVHLRLVLDPVVVLLESLTTVLTFQCIRVTHTVNAQLVTRQRMMGRKLLTALEAYAVPVHIRTLLIVMPIMVQLHLVLGRGLHVTQLTLVGLPSAMRDLPVMVHGRHVSERLLAHRAQILGLLVDRVNVHLQVPLVTEDLAAVTAHERHRIVLVVQGVVTVVRLSIFERSLADVAGDGHVQCLGPLWGRLRVNFNVMTFVQFRGSEAFRAQFALVTDLCRVLDFFAIFVHLEFGRFR
jgi:hypothetical protein